MKKVWFMCITALVLVTVMTLSLGSASGLLDKFLTGKVAADVSVGVTASGIWTSVVVTPGAGSYEPTANSTTPITFSVVATNEDKTAGNVNTTGYATISGVSNVALTCSAGPGDYQATCTGGSFSLPYYRAPGNNIGITAHIFTLYPTEGTDTGYFNWTELTSMAINATSFSGDTATGANATLAPTLVVYDTGNKNLAINGSSSNLTGTAGTILSTNVWLNNTNIGTNVLVTAINYGNGAVTDPMAFKVFAQHGLGVGSVTGTTNITAI